MVKTRSQTERITIKEEEEEHKNTRLLYNLRNTVKRTHKITKEKATKGKSNSLPLREVKVEEETDRKFSSKALSKHKKNPRVAENQIKQPIDYVENENRTVTTASRKAKISYCAGAKNHSRHKKDPKQNLFAATRQCLPYTQHEIKTLIGYIVDDGMSIRKASKTANMTFSVAQAYYKRYLANPNHNISIQRNQKNRLNRICTQDQIDRLIHHMVNNNTSIKTASIKVNIGEQTARRYYNQYLKDPDRKIPTLKHDTKKTPITEEQIQNLIGYIVKDKMSIVDASLKTNMSVQSGGRYYHQYLKDPDREIPIPRKATHSFRKPCTQEQISELIGYIVNDNMTLNDASIKANMSVSTATRYYRRYRNDPNHKIPVPNKSSESAKKRFTQKDIEDLIGHIVNDNMSVGAASVKVNMSPGVATRYYRRYLNDPERRIPSPGSCYGKQYTKDQIKEFIGYIVDDKLSVLDASIMLNMSEPTARKYYKQYLNDMVDIKNEK
ncbi:hypothetical protein K501DRAFT_271817 [Backusella circina FSU 941]|nr:hypothetical protein K501DRAFT_271817 [Backusella circina FSU 941]